MSFDEEFMQEILDSEFQLFMTSEPDDFSDLVR